MYADQEWSHNNGLKLLFRSVLASSNSETCLMRYREQTTLCSFAVAVSLSVATYPSHNSATEYANVATQPLC